MADTNIEKKDGAQAPAAKADAPAPAAKKAARVWHKDPKTGEVKEKK